MEILFSKEHEWVRIEGNTAVMGITAYAAHQLGDITYVELPKVGKTVKKDGSLCTVESVKAASDIFIPMTAKVLEVNTALDGEPQIVNSAAETDGWIAKIELQDLSEKSGLMTREQYDAFLKTL